MSNTPIFLSGLTSNLDWSSIITQLMSVERQPLVALQTQETVETARQTALNQVRTQLQGLSNAVATLRDPTTWTDVQSVDVSDATKLTATRTGGAAAGAYAVTVSQLARANQWTQSGGATSVAANDTLHITVGSGQNAKTTDVAVAAGDDLAAVAAKINGTSNTPVYASVVGSQLVLSNKTTGLDGAITSVTSGGTSGLAFAESRTATNAQLKIDGVSYERQSNIVTDALAGITLTLKSTIATTNPDTIVVGVPSPDTTNIQSKIQAFVTQYNQTVSFIEAKLNEKVVPNATTNADRVQGVLRGDTGLENLLSSLRQSVSNLVSPAPGDGAYQSVAQIGLSTGASTGTGALNHDAIAGLLTLDKSKLSDALNASFSDVHSLFSNVTNAYGSEGLAQRLDGYLNPWLIGDGTNGSIMDGRVASSQSLIDSLKRHESDLTDRLTDREAALRLQFTNMETVLSQLQAQSKWLTSQIAKLS